MRHFSIPSQDLIPTFVLRGRIEQPWGHIQVGATALGYTLNDGIVLAQILSRLWRCYLWALFYLDNLTWGAAGGEGIGDQIANNIGLATNFGGGQPQPTVARSSQRTGRFMTRRCWRRRSPRTAPESVISIGGYRRYARRSSSA